MNIQDIIKHLRHREYMSGIDRDKVRVKSTSEIFTPTELVQDMLDILDPTSFTDHTHTFLDPSCGDGQFLSEILIRKLLALNKDEISDQDLTQALTTIHGVDIMIDNVDLCRERLLCGRNKLRYIVEQNIQCRDGLKFAFNFRPMTPARQLSEEKARLKQQRNVLKLKEEEEARCIKLKQAKHEKKLFGQALA